MSSFAIERVTRTLQVTARGGTASATFGPPTQGSLQVVVSGRIAGVVPGGDGNPQPGGVLVGIPDLAMDVGFGDVTFPGSTSPPTEVVSPLPQSSIVGSAFGIEVLDASGSLRASSQGPRLEVDLPPPQGRLGPLIPQPLLAALPAPPWTIRVTNNSNFDADVTVHLEFTGLRRILSRELDVTEASRKLHEAFPQPIEVRVENRTVGEIVVQGHRIPIVHSHLVLQDARFLRVSVEGFLALQGVTDVDLSPLEEELDLGARIFTENIRAQVTPDLTIHDGHLAIKARLAFVGKLGSVDLIEALRAMGIGSGKRLVARIVAGLSGGIERTNKIHGFEAEVFFVLRSSGFHGPPPRFGPHVDVIAKTKVDLEKRLVSQLVEGALNVLLERFLPEAMGEVGGEVARRALEGLLGRAGPVITGSEQRLTILHAGEAPAPPVVARG